MSPWLLALGAGLIIALVQYGWRDFRAGWAVGVVALLRLGTITLLVALLLDAPSGRARPVTGWAALDVSASMARGDTMLWRAARDSIGKIVADSVFTFGECHNGCAEIEPASLFDNVRHPDKVLAALTPQTKLSVFELNQSL